MNMVAVVVEEGEDIVEIVDRVAGEVSEDIVEIVDRVAGGESQERGSDWDGRAGEAGG